MKINLREIHRKQAEKKYENYLKELTDNFAVEIDKIILEELLKGDKWKIKV